MSIENPIHSTASKHLMIDMWFSKPVDPVVDQLCDFVNNTFTVVQKAEHTFFPQGRTIVYILSESHFTVHTYPEHNYLTLDIYVCNPVVDLYKVCGEIVMLAKPVKHEYNIVDRGISYE